MEQLTTFLLDSGKLIYGNADSLHFVPNPSFMVVRNGEEGGKLILSTETTEEVVFMISDIAVLLHHGRERETIFWLSEKFLSVGSDRIRTRENSMEAHEYDIRQVQEALDNLVRQLTL